MRCVVNSVATTASRRYAVSPHNTVRGGREFLTRRRGSFRRGSTCARAPLSRVTLLPSLPPSCAVAVRYNLKRKIAGVGPISQEAFDRRRQAAGGDEGAAQVAPRSTGASAAPVAAPVGKPERVMFVCRPCGLEFGTRNAFNSHARSRRHKAATAPPASSSKASYVREWDGGAACAPAGVPRDGDCGGRRY